MVTVSTDQDFQTVSKQPQKFDLSKRTEVVPVMLSMERWKKVVAYLDWHGKDQESEAIVDSIREQIGDE